MDEQEEVNGRGKPAAAAGGVGVGGFAVGLMVGAVVGAVVALLFAPERGTRLRHRVGKDLLRRRRFLRARLDRLADEARDSLARPR